MNAFAPALRAATALATCDQPDIDALREAVRAALPEIAKRAPVAEQNRQVPPGNVALLREAGFLRLVQPRAFGGLEADFDVLVGLTMEVAAACASTGWVCGLAAAHQWLVANFPEERSTTCGAKTPTRLSVAPTHRRARPSPSMADGASRGGGHSPRAATSRSGRRAALCCPRPPTGSRRSRP
jgi:alkylation response protein AidB-like acyl-CoA dehydrogenase